jgi:ferredoxin, 2Fe-2S
MPTINFLLSDGTTRTVEAATGRSVMEAAIHGNVRGIDAECGGCCSCATCHVYVDESYLPLIPAADEMEDELLQGVAAERRMGSRLSCQLVVSPALDGLTVSVPESQS